MCVYDAWACSLYLSRGLFDSHYDAMVTAASDSTDTIRAATVLDGYVCRAAVIVRRAAVSKNILSVVLLLCC